MTWQSAEQKGYSRKFVKNHFLAWMEGMEGRVADPVIRRQGRVR